MTFGLELSNAGYVFDQEALIWRKDASEPFAYSDGDGVEQALAAVLRNAADVSVMSRELAAHCTDWPRRYHLHASRANLLRPLAQRLKGDVLEIGAGCGAITRFLGECGANVLALEGSPRRASIAALRAHDLPNVTVMSETFSNFKTDRRFDVVTLIGVLEYAGLFGTGEDPVNDMLKSTRALLKPDGILIIAIENQLGLKYFAGAPEDHVGARMFGINGLYAKPGVETFGKVNLERRLKDAGFASTALALPFPDYKLPSSVVLPGGLHPDSPFRAEILASQSVSKDHQINSTVLTFSLERAWASVGRNGLLDHLANSFLFVASPEGDAQAAFPADELAHHYSVERAPEFCKSTSFRRSPEGRVQVVRASIEPQGLVASVSPAATNVEYEHNISNEPFITGASLDEDFTRLVLTPGWTSKQAAGVLHRYIDVLFADAHVEGDRPSGISVDDPMPGHLLDVVPQNIVFDGQGVAHVIDHEWLSREPLPLGFLVFRALTLTVRMLSTCAVPNELELLNRQNLFVDIFAHLGLTLDKAHVEDYLQREAAFMSFATGDTCTAGTFDEWATSHLPTELDLKSYAMGDLMSTVDALSTRVRGGGPTDVEILNARLAELENERGALQEQLRAISEAERAARDDATREHENVTRTQEALALAQAEGARMKGELTAVLQSNAWRATWPVRAVAVRLKHLVR